MIEFGYVPLHEIFEEIQPNVARHYTEMSEGDDYGPPDIDWDGYLDASRRGVCGVVTMRDNGKLVGYSVYSIGRNPRYRTIIQAQSDGIFIEKEYRGALSDEFRRVADEFLSKSGINETIYILSDDRVGRFLGRGGYSSKYKVWSIKYGKL